jgi:carboxyl-terminal processing protease
LLLLLGAFVAGVYLDRAGWIPGRTDRQPASLGKTFAPFWEAWAAVQRHYVDRSAVEDKRLTEGAIRGLVKSLGDDGHTAYLSPEERRRLREGLEGQYQGIGATIRQDGNKATVVQTMPNSPARSGGIRPGDVVVEVDGQAVGGETSRAVADKVSGPAGTTVKLRVRRPGYDAPVEVTLKRACIEVPKVGWRMLPGAPVAHLGIQSFGKRTHAQLEKALADLRAAGARGLILDLRGNPGGLKDQAVAVTGEFLKKGQVVFIQQDAQGRQEKMLTQAEGKATDLPLVVLIDRGTASSSEILAGALQDHGRARVVGTRSFGTGTVLREVGLSDGSALYLAYYQWLTPKGRKIWHLGISPDKGLEVSLAPGVAPLRADTESSLSEDALSRSGDRPLLKALEVLRKQLPPAPKAAAVPPA